jgi:hypothetical protein
VAAWPGEWWPCFDAMQEDTGPACTSHAPPPHERAGLLAVLARRLNSWAPAAKRALAECLLPAAAAVASSPRLSDAPPSPLRIPADFAVCIEALGSGGVIVASLSVDPDATTVGDLKRRLRDANRAAAVAAAAAAGEGYEEKDGVTVVVRLFLGHGGPELAPNTRTLRDCAVESGAVLVRALSEHVGSYEQMERGDVHLLWAALHGLRGHACEVIRRMSLTPQDTPWYPLHQDVYHPERYLDDTVDEYTIIGYARFHKLSCLDALEDWDYS